MSNNNNEIMEGQESAPRVFKTNESISLTDITLGLIGSTHKGPAFVPQTLQTFGKDDNSSGTLNTFENQFGALEDLSDHNLTHYSAYEWFSQGGEQLAITRVLGTGPESGFTVGAQIVSGSSELGKTSESSFASPSGSNGKTYFLGQVIKNNQFESDGVNHRISSYNDYLEQIGISDSDTPGLILTECLFSAHGSNLFLEKKIIDRIALPNLDLEKQSPTSILLDNFSEIGNPRLFISGLKDTEFRYVETFNKLNLRHHQFNENKVNIESRWNLHKGHLNYASWGSQIDFKQTNLVDNNNSINIFLVQKNNDTPDYENFRSSYKTAETPWVVSQPLNREGLSISRVDMHKNCINLFKFVALDDGEIGNRYRIRISPQRSGNRITKDWAKFGVSVWEYNKKTNSFEQLLQYRDLDLNPDSPDYIGRIFGTKHEYYSMETSKVQTDGLYETRNNHLRVVINDKIEYGEVDSWNLIPSGFKPYPRIDTANLIYLGNETRQKPIEYASNLLFTNIRKKVSAKDDSIVFHKDKHWGVAFENSSSLVILEKIFNDESFAVRVKKYREYEEGAIRRFTQYAKYFQDSLTNGNVWIRDLEDNKDDSTHSFFHLEKILKEKSVDPTSGVQNQWLYSMYRRDGKEPGSISSLEDASGSFEYVNIEKELSSADGSDSINSIYLNFDFFTYGGFDGLNILDHDKHMMNQAALIREIEDEKKDGSTSGLTRSSYELAHDILIDDANSEIDALVFPQVGHNTFNKRIANICNEKEKYVAILNVADFYSDGINLNPNYHDFNPEEVDEFKRVSITGNTRKKLSDGVNTTIDSVTSTYFNGKYILNVCNALESAFSNSMISDKIFTNLPSFRLVSSMPRSLNLPLDSISDFSSSDIKVQKILNSTFENSSNNTNSSLIRKSLSSSVNFLVTEGSEIVLNSSNTAIYNRNSLNRFLHNVRIMIDIKKKMKYLIFQTDVLFNNNPSIDNLASKLNLNVQSLLQSYVDRGIIKNFYVKNNTGQTAIERLDTQNNILRSSIAISLFGKVEDVIEEIRIADLLNSVQNNLTEAANLDIVLPTV